MKKVNISLVIEVANALNSDDLNSAHKASKSLFLICNMLVKATAARLHFQSNKIEKCRHSIL